MSDNPMATSLLRALWLGCVCVCGMFKGDCPKTSRKRPKNQRIEHPQIYSGTPMNTQTL